MKKIIIIGFALAMIVGCKKVDVNFDYSPAEPKAGESITFTNRSSAGESWTWTFGDNATSLLKNPKKIYKKPGEYVVTLMVDSAKYLTHSKVIVVYDTVPTFVSSSDSILHYQDVTFTANVYNPFNYELTYDWVLPEDCKIVAGSRTSKTVTAYFTTVGKKSVELNLTQKDTQYNIPKEFDVHLSKAPAIVMRKTDKTVVRQRMINDRLEQVNMATAEDVHLIEQTNDTVVTFNEKTFYASQMANTVAGFTGLTINHIQIDAMAQKWYITTPEGLFVANMDGSYMEGIDPSATGAIFVDTYRNRIYWANNNGVYAMALVKSKNNRFTTTPTQYNDLTNVDLIAVNEKLQ